MRLKRKIRRIFDLILLGLILTGMGLMLGFVDHEQNGTICKKVEITMHYGPAEILIPESDIDSLIRQQSGVIQGLPMWRINTEKIERAITKQPYVLQANVFETYPGDVHVHVFQRQPALRIMTETNKGYYIGDEGVILPINPDHPARVLIASGHIPDTCFVGSSAGSEQQPAASANSSRLLSDLYKLALFVNRKSFFKAQIDQIYVNKNGEYELIPKVGDHVVLLGNIEDLEDKFQRLFIFYKKGLNQIGWNRYNVINIKYKNQVVCSKI